jgi:hypothetical protein
MLSDVRYDLTSKRLVNFYVIQSFITVFTKASPEPVESNGHPSTYSCKRSNTAISSTTRTYSGLLSQQSVRPIFNFTMRATFPAHHNFLILFRESKNNKILFQAIIFSLLFLPPSQLQANTSASFSQINSLCVLSWRWWTLVAYRHKKSRYDTSLRRMLVKREKRLRLTHIPISRWSLFHYCCLFMCPVVQPTGH